MSKCMTIADETIDQKDIFTEINPKDVVDLILEEVLLSAFFISDKGCSRIGDFNITDDFRQQDQHPHPKDFEQVDNSQSEEKQESNLNSGENVDRSARENLGLIIDSFVKKEEKFKPAGEYTVISEEVLANNELQIQNGQIHLETSKTSENKDQRSSYFIKQDVVLDEKIEIEYFNQGKLNKIYVPLNPSIGADVDCASGVEREEKKESPEAKEKEVQDVSDKARGKENPERPFKPFTTEELRQVWGNGNSALVGKWDGDVLAQPEEAVRLMEELSSVHLFNDSSADLNRPRACAFAEEDVKKMIKEIEEISFTQCHTNSEDSDVAYHPDGQGDADLETKSFTKSKDSIAKLQKCQKPQEEFFSSLISESKHTDEAQVANESTESKPFKNENDCSTIPGSQLNFIVENAQSCKDSENDSSMSPTENVDSEQQDDKRSEMFLMDSDSPRDFQKDMSSSEEYIPETMSLSGNKGSTDGSKIDEFTLRNLEFASELDMKAFQSKRSDLKKGSRSVDNTHDKASEMNNQGTISLGRLNAASSETYKRLDPDSLSEEKDLHLFSMETNLFVKKSEEMRKSQDAGNFLQGFELSVDIPKNEEDSNLIEGGIWEKLENSTFVRSTENVEIKDGESAGAEATKMMPEEKSIPMEDTNNLLLEDQDRNNCSNENQAYQEVLLSSLTPSQTQLSSESLCSENGLTENSEAISQNFKLRSQKMYLGANYEAPNKFSLTESEEAFLDLTESVIQIINPPENNVEEDSSKISFMLLSEVLNQKSLPRSVEGGPGIVMEKSVSSDQDNPPKRVFSGMTTIGPVKNIDYDPKDLTGPEIDFGKMTRITSSRQLANDIGLFNPEAAAIKILEEDDSDDNASVNIEEDQLENNSLINRDIASLTKVQKIREVMSYQPKPEEDLEDDEVLGRPRLDLKDVESMTDERYKVPDVSIPLMSFEIGERDFNEKELMSSMSLVISGLTNPAYYDDEIEDNGEIQRYTSDPDAEYNKSSEIMNKKSSKTLSKNQEGEMSKTSSETESKSNLEPERESESENEMEESSKFPNDSQPEEVFNYQKYGTLGSVFKKASNKFIRKDGDVFVRNSKSLPRETSRTSATESIRSMLDDCQSSASNILKKSCSLLKNTQSVFKSISQGRVGSDLGVGRSGDQKKPFSPSDTDVATEKKFSGFLKKEDFAKAKNLLKGKVEKALKSTDAENLEATEQENLPRKSELRIAIRNKENLQVDRMENFKKLLPKTPLVYKSQFIRSQMNVQSNPTESTGGLPNDENQRNSEEAFNDSVCENNSEMVPEEETAVSEYHEEAESENQIAFEDKLQWISSRENIKTLTKEELEPLEPQQPDFIVMETVQGLPPGSDLESPSSEKENLNVDNIGKTETEKEGNESKKTEASNSLQMFPDGGHDVAPCFPEIDDEKSITKIPSERKIKTKKKKLSARFRSFWSSAFGRVKTPPTKGDLS